MFLMSFPPGLLLLRYLFASVDESVSQIVYVHVRCSTLHTRVDYYGMFAGILYDRNIVHSGHFSSGGGGEGSIGTVHDAVPMRVVMQCRAHRRLYLSYHSLVQVWK